LRLMDGMFILDIQYSSFSSEFISTICHNRFSYEIIQG
jgi:hypothetical protein